VEIGISLSQDTTFHDPNNKGHGTSSTLEFLNHRWPVTANPVAELMNSSLSSSCMVTYFIPAPVKGKGELLCKKKIETLKPLYKHQPTIVF
jgi:hypothetical protein